MPYQPLHERISGPASESESKSEPEDEPNTQRSPQSSQKEDNNGNPSDARGSVLSDSKDHPTNPSSQRSKRILRQRERLCGILEDIDTLLLYLEGEMPIKQVYKRISGLPSKMQTTQDGGIKSPVSPALYSICSTLFDVFRNLTLQTNMKNLDDVIEN